jgi:phosphatidylinositol alpha 1,6-mannosyltransferase
VSELPRRVAYFTDTYLEVDGVANTARHFEAYARRLQVPFLMVHGGYEHEKVFQDGAFTRVELPRGRFSFTLDKKHDFDLAFLRHRPRVVELLAQFKPDVLHITGPSDVGMLGALVAHRMKIPLVGSWHTNLHEYAERRVLPLLRFLPSATGRNLAQSIRDLSFRLTARFYQIPRVLMAPNRELIALLEKTTRKPCFLMARGVDTNLFNPARRNRAGSPFTIGYVGRLTIEKNIGDLVEIERALLAAGLTGFRFFIDGQGSSEPSLRASLKNRDLVGVLTGEDLARAYANMDLFVFPSRTDAFGNVVLEALASGVPALVTDQGGPQFIVREGESGYVCSNTAVFVDHILRLSQSPDELARMRLHARELAEKTTWDSVFEAVYRAYEVALQPSASDRIRIVTNLPVQI